MPLTTPQAPPLRPPGPQPQSPRPPGWGAVRGLRWLTAGAAAAAAAAAQAWPQTQPSESGLVAASTERSFTVQGEKVRVQAVVSTLLPWACSQPQGYTQTHTSATACRLHITE